MTGEMSREDVTPEAYPMHFAIANGLAGTVHPFDVYQGPFMLVRGHRLWLMNDGDGDIALYDETAHRQTDYYPDCLWTDSAVEIATGLLDGDGFDPDMAKPREDAIRLADIGEG